MVMEWPLTLKVQNCWAREGYPRDLTQRSQHDPEKPAQGTFNFYIG